MSEPIVANKTDMRRLYMEYAPRLVLFASRFVGGSVAEDIVQDVFLKLMGREIYNSSETQTKALLFLIVKNECIDCLRRKNYKSSHTDNITLGLKELELDYYGSLEEALVTEETIVKIMGAAEQMPEKRREIFYLYYRDGKRIAEIAAMLNLSERTVENQIYRALSHLRKTF